MIRSRQLDLNGMILAPQSGGYGVFKIETQKKLGIGTYTWLSGPTVSFELLNTPIGDVTLGGRDLEAEPVELAFTAFHPETLPSRPPPRAGRPSRRRPVEDALDGVAVGQECGSEKKATCCPPNGRPPARRSRGTSRWAARSTSTSTTKDACCSMSRSRSTSPRWNSKRPARWRSSLTRTRG